MTDSAGPSAVTIISLPASDADWAGVLAQYTMLLVKRQGRPFASMAAERLLRATRNCAGVVALADGQLLGIILYEVADQAIELTLPWVATDDSAVASELALAAMQVARERFPDARYIRAERQLFPGEPIPLGLADAGFDCHWRCRMMMELIDWRNDAHIPTGYRIRHWNIDYLDAAAEVVYRANLGTLDAKLYAPFFGESPAQCRKGLLAILAGRYGPIHPRATLVVFSPDARLVGINLVMSENRDLASVIELSVDPDHQRKGLGRALMAHSLRVLKHEGIERVELAVTAENTNAMRLYESLGFSQISTFPVCVWPVG